MNKSPKCKQNFDRNKGKIQNRKERRNNEHKEMEEKLQLCHEVDADNIKSFEDFPISNRTLKGLSDAGYKEPTDIQKNGIALALRGLDILGAAKTGSGKTLAFLVPILELLWHNKWSNTDGLGALIITPTRELALQIFEVLRKIGKQHDFSAGLIIGGKDVEQEQKRIQNTNIIICTPGRLLQHFDETAGFQCDDLKILVLDEADRILDLGFADTMNAIIENLPEQRLTLLYSATQTKSVKDLARLSLTNPEYIAVHENAQYATPKKLIQNYVTVDIEAKINFLYSFIKSHLKSKCIVFLSCCKQVKFLYEVFRKTRPGVLLLALYGTQKQMKRTVIYNKFCTSNHAILFSTDVAARGLDFPAVNWVLQYDCPESTDTYIHRVGRTARYEKGGHALLMLLKSETAIIEKLGEKKIPIHEIKPNPKKIFSIQGKLQAFCAENQEVKQWAQRSIVSYARSVHLQSDKNIFDVNQIDFEKLATSMGLLAPPKIRFLKKIERKFGPTASSSKSMNEFKSEKKKEKSKLGIEILSDRSQDKTSVYESHDTKSGISLANDDDSDDDVLVQKTTNLHHENLDDQKIDLEEPFTSVAKHKAVSKITLAKKIIRKNIKVNTKVVFDEEGNVVTPMGKGSDIITHDIGERDSEDNGGLNVQQAMERMKEEDRLDKQRDRKRIKEKHREKKRKEKRDRTNESMEEMQVTLGGRHDDEVDDFQGTMDESSGEEKELVEHTEEEQPKRKRRKMLKKEREFEQIESEMFEDTLLTEDEHLALHLLGVS